ncbi:MAG TPA: hypothetical protein VE664_04745 [Actinomycetes bacterium]|jgi:hypothetical protein|nr:hypothetical protein [Actinomycetes bacterium]
MLARLNDLGLADINAKPDAACRDLVSPDCRKRIREAWWSDPTT